jgi:tripartite ATP-independent transporter DctM subunit
MEMDVILVVLMFVSFGVLLFSGFPVAFVLGGVGLLFVLVGEILNRQGIYVSADLNYLSFVVNRMYGYMSGYSLVPVPLFIFMGHMLDRSGTVQQLLRSMQLLLGPMPGGMAIAVMVIGVLLAASTGIVGATVVLLTTLTLPTMLKAGYDPKLAIGTICSAGGLGVLIPPSILLVMMADQMLLSVGALFMGALGPGLLLAGLYLVYIIVVTLISPKLAPPLPLEERMAISGIAKIILLIRTLIPPLALIFLVLGSIFFGIASPTEAAGVGAFGAAVIAAANGRLSFNSLREVSIATTRTTAFVFAIILGATCFTVVLRGLGGDDVIHDLITGLPLGTTGTVILILAVVFVLGFFLDFIEIVFIVLPIVFPIVRTLGVDPLWFTVMVAVCLQTSYLTPPVGFALFYFRSAAPPSIELGTIYRAIIPFVAIQVLCLIFVFLIPGIVTWLPSVMR